MLIKAKTMVEKCIFERIEYDHLNIVYVKLVFNGIKTLSRGLIGD